MADWEYINSCAIAASPMPLFGECTVVFKVEGTVCICVAGNGDVLSYEDYNQHVAGGSIAGTMIAR